MPPALFTLGTTTFPRASAARMLLRISLAQSCSCRGCSPRREDQLKHCLFAQAACSPWLILGLLPVLMKKAERCLPASGLIQSHRHVLAPKSQAKECATSGSFLCLGVIPCGMAAACGGEGFGVAGAGHPVLVPGLALLWPQPSLSHGSGAPAALAMAEWCCASRG